MTALDRIDYRMRVIRAIRQGEVWREGSHFFNRERALKKAANYFEFFNLSDPEERDELLLVLADVLFGRDAVGRQKGQKAWTKEKLARLGRLEIQIKQKYPKLKSDNKIAKIIIAEHKEFHSADTVRRRLPEARLAVAGVGKLI